jgi:LysR family glycine cleavage system transcriptional activator
MDESNLPVRRPRRLPSLAALRAFEAAAAHLSFQRAALELNVTPAAVSHQVRSLEAELGTPLFHRLTRQVRLTDEGAKLFERVKEGLDILELAVAGLRLEDGAKTLTLTTNAAFAARWLLPRMASLKAAVPSIQIRLEATEAVADLSRGEADLAIRSGDGNWPGLATRLLAREHYAPMCTPTLGIARPADLRHTKLIEFDWQPQAKSPALWPRWFREAGMREPRRVEKLVFSDENHAALAVLAGHGVGLLSTTLMASELASGALVSPFAPRLATGAYYLAAMPSRRREAAIAAVWDWLAAQFDGETAMP